MSRSNSISPSELPLVVYDGDCRFCRAKVDRWREATGECLHFKPYQEIAGKLPDIDEGQFRRAVHYVAADSAVSRGAEAVFRAMGIAARSVGFFGSTRRCRRSRSLPSGVTVASPLTARRSPPFIASGTERICSRRRFTSPARSFCV